MVVVHVDGVQGAGKSFLCGKLAARGVLCVDTDSFMHLPTREARAFVQRTVRENAHVVFAGMTADIPQADLRFFIRLDDPFETYKRLMLRELAKIVASEAAVRAHIRAAKTPRDLRIGQTAGLSVLFPVGYRDMLQDYRERRRAAAAAGYRVLLPADILREILSACK